MLPNTPQEGLNHSETPQDHSASTIPETQESAETPSLTVEVVDKCASEGRYVGLGGKQRRALGVELSDVVLITQGDQSLGLYVVGKGKKALLKENGKCVGNLPEGVSGLVELRPVTDQILEEKTFDFSVSSSPESDPRHEGRLEKIASRFPELEQGSYMVIPTSLAVLMDAPYANPDRKTLRMIFKGNLKIGEEVHELAFVPSGDDVAVTDVLAEQLNMKTASKISVGLQDGELVVDKIS